MNRVKLTKKGFQNGPSPKRSRGRPAGTPNKTTRLLKEAILMAGENVGNGMRPDGGLVAYLEWMARVETPSFASLLGKVLPMQITGGDGKPLRVIEASLTPQQAMQLYVETLRELNADSTLKLPNNTKVIDHGDS